MAIRVFTCTACGHKMRFTDNICHACYAKKHAYQSPSVILGAAFGIFMLLVMATLLLA